MSTFFLDRNLGTRKFANELYQAGVDFRLHDDLFPQNTPDDVWIPAVCNQGWVILTLDKRTRRRRIEKQAILVHGARVIYFNAKTGDMVALAKGFISILPKVERFIESHPGQFLAIITQRQPKKYPYNNTSAYQIRQLEL